MTVSILIILQGILIATLSATSGDFFVEEPKDVVVFENQPATFECKYQQVAAKCIFSYRTNFFFSSREDDEDYGMVSREGYCALTIKKATGDADGSKFQCTIFVDEGGDHYESKEVTLKVLIPPKSLQMAVKTSVDVDTLPDGTVQVVEGRTIEFTCHVIGARPAVGIDWYLDGQLLAPELYNQVEEVSQNDVYDTHSTLTITMSKNDDGAELSCVTPVQKNVITNFKKAKNLSVLYAPTSVFLNTVDLSKPFKVGDDVTVECYCNNGNPLPQLKLYLNDQELEVSNAIINNNVSVGFSFKAESGHHNAMFKCVAVSEFSSNTPNIFSQQVIQVYFKPATVHISGYNRAIRMGDVVSLECRTDRSFPAAQVLWTLNESPIPEGETQQRISGNSSRGYVTTSLYDIVINDDSIATVACQAKNPRFPGIVTRDTTEIQIQYLPTVPHLVVDPAYPDHTYREDESVRLSCSSQGRPIPLISWYRDTTFLDSGADPVIDPVTGEDTGTVVYSISLSRLSRDDHGKEFSCTAENVVVGDNLKPPSTSIAFKVYYAPKSVTVSSNVEKPFLEKKMGVEFICTTDKMNPNAVIFEWFINGVPVNSGNIETNDPLTQPNGFILSNTMKLNRPIREDDHNIPVTCKVTPVEFDDLVLSATYHMEVYFEPYLESKDPVKVTVNETSSVVLDCGDAHTNPPIAYYQWTGKRITQTPTGTLQMGDVQRGASGDYYCKACNCDNPSNKDLCPWTSCSTTRLISLIVEYPPTLVVKSQVLEVDVNANAVLTCTQSANPTGQVFWMYEDQVIDRHSTLKYNISVSSSEGTHSQSRDQVSTLTIYSVVQADAGMYSCGVVNKLGEAQNKIQVAVKHAPYFESRENTDLVISGREGEFSATLSCVANGYPELNFDWINYPPGQSTTKRISQISASKWRSELTISPLYPNSFGNYTCTAKNNMGASTWKVELSKPRAPDAPRNFVIQQTGHDFQSLKWTAGRNGGYPQNFEILYQVLGKENEGWKISTVNLQTTSNRQVDPGSQLNFTVQGLAPSTTYIFKVCAYNRVGPTDREKDCSEIIQATTYAAPLLAAQKSFREMPMWLMIALPTLTGLFIVTNIIFLTVYCRRRFCKKKRADERPFSISTQSSSRADHGLLYQDNYYHPAGSDRWAPGGGSDMGDKDSRYFSHYSGSPPQMNPMDLFERGTAASTHSDDTSHKMHVTSEFDPTCRINPSTGGYPLYLQGPRHSNQWPMAFPSRSPYDPTLTPMSHEEMYRNQIRQKARQGNRQGESYLQGESRSSTPIQGPPHPNTNIHANPLSGLNASTAAQQEQQSLNRYDSLAESHQESNTSAESCTNAEESGRGSACNLENNSSSNQEHQQCSLYSNKL